MAEDDHASYKKYFQTGKKEDLTEYAKKKIKLYRAENAAQVELVPEDVSMIEQCHEVDNSVANDLNIISTDPDSDIYDSCDEPFFDAERDFDIHGCYDAPIFSGTNQKELTESLDENGLLSEMFEDEENCNNNEGKGIKNLKHLMNSARYNEKINTSIAVTPLEILFMVLKFSIVNKLPLTTLSNLIALINCMFVEPIIPASRYMIDKFFNETKNTEFHVTCSKCHRYVDKLQNVVGNYSCRRCKSEINVSNEIINDCIAVIDPSETIEQLLEAHEDYYYDTLYKEREPEFIKDIYDGKLYKQFKNSLPPEEKFDFVTATINTDGAEPFNKSPRSLWPLYLMLNELPPQERFNNIIPCVLWFNRKKPKMECFLKIFVDMIKSVQKKGIKCVIKGKVKSVKLYPLVSCVDTVARAPMQGFTQFNGKFGCNWCEHPTEYVINVTKYPLTKTVISSRTKEKTEQIMRSLPAVVTKRVIRENKGVCSKSPLIELPFFDIIESFVPDYMHAILPGVGKQVTGYIIPENERNGRDEEYLKTIKLPNQVSRFTRPIEDCKYWKAREWENWILYVSIVIFQAKKKKNEIIEYWSLLVDSLHLLLKSKISYSEINLANEYLCRFVILTEKYFNKRAMTYNIHQLLHITNSVVNWGPLWAHSAFSFEAGNHKLIQSIHCGNGVIQQILRFINISNSVSLLENKVLSSYEEHIKVFYNNTVSKKTKKFVKVNKITYFGKGRPIDIQTQGGLQFSENSNFYQRMVKDGCLYLSSTIENRRSDNSIASYLEEGIEKYMKIIEFAVDHGKKKEIVIFKPINVSNEKITKYCSTIKKVISIADTELAIDTNTITSICVNIKINNNQFICKVPNLYYY